MITSSLKLVAATAGLTLSLLSASDTTPPSHLKGNIGSLHPLPQIPERPLYLLQSLPLRNRGPKERTTAETAPRNVQPAHLLPNAARQILGNLIVVEHHPNLIQRDEIPLAHPILSVGDGKLRISPNVHRSCRCRSASLERHNVETR